MRGVASAVSKRVHAENSVSPRGRNPQLAQSGRKSAIKLATLVREFIQPLLQPRRHRIEAERAEHEWRGGLGVCVCAIVFRRGKVALMRWTAPRRHQLCQDGVVKTLI